VARRRKQTKLKLGKASRYRGLADKAKLAVERQAVGGKGAVRRRGARMAGNARAQMTGRIPPIRGRRKGGRAAARRRHPTGTESSRSMRAGGALGKRAGFMAAGFANSAGTAYKTGRKKSGGTTLKTMARSKNAKYAAAGLGGAVAARGAYGLAKARMGRSQNVTQVNVTLQNSGGSGKKKGRRARRRDRRRRDRYGRFR
jgi:hypothetical protein